MICSIKIELVVTRVNQPTQITQVRAFVEKPKKKQSKEEQTWETVDDFHAEQKTHIIGKLKKELTGWCTRAQGYALVYNDSDFTSLVEEIQALLDREQESLQEAAG